MGSQLVSQLGNTLGLLAQSYPSVANAILHGGGTGTGTPTQLAQSAFNNGFSTGTTPGFIGFGMALIAPDTPRFTRREAAADPTMRPVASSWTSTVRSVMMGDGCIGAPRAPVRTVPS